MQILLRVYLPMAAPSVAATTRLNTIRIWNELAGALGLTFDKAQTVTLAVAAYRGYASMDWGALSAAAITSILPTLIFAVLALRQILGGLGPGAVKRSIVARGPDIATVEFQSVGISFANVPVVKDLSLTVNEGEFVVLVGSSGCRKSTTLRSIAGLAGISSGDMRIGGRRMNDAGPAGWGIAMVFQSHALFPGMTVAGNLEFGLKIRGEGMAEIDRKVAEAAAVVGLSHHLHKRPRALSGGQHQRVTPARAILRRLGVFLFDEPLSNPDAGFRTAMRAEIVRFHRTQGAFMVHVTQDQTEAMTMGNSIAVSGPAVAAGHKANLMQFGTPDKVYHCPTKPVHCPLHRHRAHERRDPCRRRRRSPLRQPDDCPATGGRPTGEGHPRPTARALAPVPARARMAPMVRPCAGR